MASLAGHDKVASDAQFLELLALIERAARDERHFVIKGVSWATAPNRDAQLDAPCGRARRRAAPFGVEGSRG
jgi:hypothetical protein